MAVELTNINEKAEFQESLRKKSMSGEDPIVLLARSGLSMPSHVAIIPDGNGRWAKKNGLPILEGHNKGAKVLENLLDDLENIPDIKLITLWALSVDNLVKRSEIEVSNIMSLAESMIDRLLPSIKARGNKFLHIGDVTKLPKSLQEKLINAQDETSQNKGKTIRIGINYQGFQEDVALVNAAIEQFSTFGRRPSSRADIEDLKRISQTPHADFVIRTSGEQRFSGFGAIAEQAEFYAPSTLLPDMTSLDWALALSEYGFRDMRFGGRK
ncbi:MAG TPA: polyprenyl diphosphate synthase [Patescibacteria group bacterium]